MPGYCQNVWSCGHIHVGQPCCVADVCCLRTMFGLGGGLYNHMEMHLISPAEGILLTAVTV